MPMAGRRRSAWKTERAQGIGSVSNAPLPSPVRDFSLACHREVPAVST